MGVMIMQELWTQIQENLSFVCVTGGVILGLALLARLADAGVRGIVWLALGCFVLAAVVALLAERTLRRV